MRQVQYVIRFKRLRWGDDRGAEWRRQQLESEDHVQVIHGYRPVTAMSDYVQCTV